MCLVNGMLYLCDIEKIVKNDLAEHHGNQSSLSDEDPYPKELTTISEAKS